MKKILLLFLSFVLLTSNTSMAVTKVTHLKDLVSNPKMMKAESANIGPYKGEISYRESSVKGTFAGLLWYTEENVSWTKLDKELTKEFVGLSSIPTLEKPVIWKNFEISKSSYSDIKNGKTINSKSYFIARIPSESVVKPQYILSNASKLDYLMDINPGKSLGRASDIPYLDQKVTVELFKEIDDYRVLYTFKSTDDSNELLTDSWEKLDLPGVPKFNVIVTKDDFNYLFYKYYSVRLTVGKNTSCTFEQNATREANENNTTFGWDTENSPFMSHSPFLRVHKQVNFENYLFDVTDKPGYHNFYPAETLIKLPPELTSQDFWEILKSKYDFVGDKFPTKYIRISDYEFKFDDRTLYFRYCLYPEYVSPLTLVTNGLSSHSLPEQITAAENMFVIENMNLNGYNCRIEMLDKGINVEECEVFYYIETTDSLPFVWKAFSDYFSCTDDNFIGLPSSKDFEIKSTDPYGDCVYTRLYKQTENQIILKSSR